MFVYNVWLRFRIQGIYIYILIICNVLWQLLFGIGYLGSLESLVFALWICINVSLVLTKFKVFGSRKGAKYLVKVLCLCRSLVYLVGKEIYNLQLFLFNPRHLLGSGYSFGIPFVFCTRSFFVRHTNELACFHCFVVWICHIGFI